MADRRHASTRSEHNLLMDRSTGLFGHSTLSRTDRLHCAIGGFFPTFIPPVLADKKSSGPTPPTDPMPLVPTFRANLRAGVVARLQVTTLLAMAMLNGAVRCTVRHNWSAVTSAPRTD